MTKKYLLSQLTINLYQLNLQMFALFKKKNHMTLLID